MRFALDFSHHAWARDTHGSAAARTLAIAAAADVAGIDAIWLNEDPEGWDAFVVLGALAAVTARAQLGTSVTSPYPRHPNLLAASAATLDRLAPGRAVLGLGRGQIEWHRDALGVETGAPLSVLRETITLLRAWWLAPYRATSPDDGHFRVRDWERELAPLPRSDAQPIPVYLAAAGPQALALAGEMADGVIFNLLTSPDALRNAIPRVRQAAEAAGRDPAQLAFVLRTLVIVDPEQERRALDRQKSLFALIASLPGMGMMSNLEGHDLPEIVRRVRQIMGTDAVLAAGGGFPALRRRGALTAAREAIPDDVIRQLAIVGTLDEVRARLDTLAALGVTHVGVAPPPEPTSTESWRRLLHGLRQG